VKTGFSLHKDENKAVQEILEQIKQEDVKCVVFFVSSYYDQQKIAETINRCKAADSVYRGAEFVGCTSAGEITQQGFLTGGIAAMSFAAPDLAVGVGVGKQINGNPIGAAKKAVEKACAQLGIATDELNDTQYTGLVLIDGLQSVEEYVMLGISKTARCLRIVGGSAGDDFNFRSTIIHARGKTYENAMVLLIFKADIPVYIAQVNSYLPTKKRLKITKADLENRIVYEFNGRPAADMYANALGIEVEALNADVFVQYPLALSVGNEYYIRSPLKVLREKGALTFFSSIAEGTRVTVMRSGRFVQEIQDTIKKIQQEMQDISAIIAFNCIWRYRESERTGNLDKIVKELSIAPLLGFNTYGEQYNGMHVNQTMTLLVFGRD